MSRVVVRVRKTESAVNTHAVSLPKRSPKERALFDAGRRYVSFFWPIRLMDALIALAEAEGVRPNLYVQSLAERHVEGLSGASCPENQQLDSLTEGPTSAEVFRTNLVPAVNATLSQREEEKRMNSS